ncbi:MAG: diaminopimelate epimerase, partial [Lysobacteraceae bacterium]
HLLEEGLVETGAPVRVGTRDGVKIVTVVGDELRVDMGPFVAGDVSEITVGDHAWKAREIHTGNPHAVAFVDAVADAGPLLEEPGYDVAVYPDGVNIEFVERIEDRHVAMRVHERGSGETTADGCSALNLI